MYAAYTSDNQLENHESLEGKRVEKEFRQITLPDLWSTTVICPFPSYGYSER